MRWSVECEVWSVKSAVWSVKCGAWRVQCEEWSVECEMWKCEESSENCEVWSAKCEVWSVKCAVWSLQSAVWSEVWSAKSAVSSVKCGVWSVECEECCEKCEVWSGASSVTFETGHHFRRMHARAWLAHGACKFYRWERSYSISLRQLPPRLVRVLLVCIHKFRTFKSKLQSRQNMSKHMQLMGCLRSAFRSFSAVVAAWGSFWASGPSLAKQISTIILARLSKHHCKYHAWML